MGDFAKNQPAGAGAHNLWMCNQLANDVRPRQVPEQVSTVEPIMRVCASCDEMVQSGVGTPRELAKYGALVNRR